MMVELGRAVSGLEEEAALARSRYASLRSSVVEAAETAQARLEDRGLVISANSEISQELEAQKKSLREEERRVREYHALANAKVDAEFERQARSLEATRKALEAELVELGSLGGTREDGLAQELEGARARFAEAQAEHRRSLDLLEEDVKRDELRWMARMVRSRDSGSKAKKDVVERLTTKFGAMQREHGELSAKMRAQSRRISALLAQNKNLRARATLAAVDYCCLSEMNHLSHRKLAHLSQISPPDDSIAAFDTVCTPARPTRPRPSGKSYCHRANHRLAADPSSLRRIDDDDDGGDFDECCFPATESFSSSSAIPPPPEPTQPAPGGFDDDDDDDRLTALVATQARNAELIHQTVRYNAFLAEAVTG